MHNLIQQQCLMQEEQLKKNVILVKTDKNLSIRNHYRQIWQLLY